MDRIKRYTLPTIVFSQFCCTSLWFAGNSIMAELVKVFGLGVEALSGLTAAVQFGFISGTLLFAVFSVADRFSPSKLFLICALCGAAFNALLGWEGNSYFSLLSLRFCTGFFLAGIYPVGMKIAADYFNKGLGTSLGYLVGALVLGTAFPHLLKGMLANLPWESILYATSALAVAGGMLIWLLVPNGPYRKAALKVDFRSFLDVFKIKPFRKAAFGYFGHMWELYTFWAFVPLLLSSYCDLHGYNINTSVWSFYVIAVGSLACVASGYLSLRFGTDKTAFLSLLLSGVCCLLLPFIMMLDSLWFFQAFLLFWGMVVIADSPLFSTLVAQNAPSKNKGTALTIVTCIGFAVTIGSIQLLGWLWTETTSIWVFTALAVGPIYGLTSMVKKSSKVEV